MTDNTPINPIINPHAAREQQLSSTCVGVNIQPTRLDINGVNHAVNVAHKCGLKSGDHTSCRCPCGLSWVKNFK